MGQRQEPNSDDAQLAASLRSLKLDPPNAHALSANEPTTDGAVDEGFHEECPFPSPEDLKWQMSPPQFVGMSPSDRFAHKCRVSQEVHRPSSSGSHSRHHKLHVVTSPQGFHYGKFVEHA
jgi:hypothetical protein